MPSGTADIYFPDGAEWVAGDSAATIHNPTPFQFDSALCWVKQCGHTWLVDRPAEWRPAAHLQCGTVGIVNPVRWGSLPYHKGNIIRRENSNGRIVINAPVSGQPFRLQIRIRVTIDPGQIEWTGRMQLHGNLYGTSIVDEVRFGPSASTNGNGYLELAYEEIVNWSQDDYFEVHLYDAAGNAPGADFGYMTIEPLF